jgi:nicotinate phosphoribosyltransferase
MILKTDLYQLTMMAGYFHSGLASKVVTCEAFARKLPPKRRFLVMAGTEEIRETLCRFRFSLEEVKFLQTIPALREAMTPSFVDWLLDFSFTGDLWAMAEGEIVFPGEPLVRITAPLPQAQLAETIILSILNHDIRVVSKAARIILAARGKAVIEFGTRRTHHEAALRSARAAYLAGFSATSNVEAGFQFGIPLAGTVAHMWTMVNKNEQDAFQKWASLWQDPIMIIDTYNTQKGAELAAQIEKIKGVRIDSGNFMTDSKFVRHILDERGSKARIMVSGDLDEYVIYDLVSGGAPIDAFGVGTKLVAPDDAPSLGIVYKVVYDETEKRPLIKTSGGKATMPGRKQVFLDQREGGWTHLVALDGVIEASDLLSPLLDQHISKGLVVHDMREVTLEVSRRYCNASLTSLSGLPVGYDLSSLLEPNIGVPVHPHESLTKMFVEARCAVER